MTKDQILENVRDMNTDELYDLIDELNELIDYKENENCRSSVSCGSSVDPNQLRVGDVFKFKTVKGGIVYREIRNINERNLNCLKLKHDKDSDTYTRTQFESNCTIDDVYKIVRNPNFID